MSQIEKLQAQMSQVVATCGNASVTMTLREAFELLKAPAPEEEGSLQKLADEVLELRGSFESSQDELATCRARLYEAEQELCVANDRLAQIVAGTELKVTSWGSLANESCYLEIGEQTIRQLIEVVAKPEGFGLQECTIRKEIGRAHV